MTSEATTSLAASMSKMPDSKLLDMFAGGPEGMRSEEAWGVLRAEVGRRFGGNAEASEAFQRVANGFCVDCFLETQDMSPGNIGTVNGTGVQWYGAENPCDQCGSVIRSLRPCILWLPLPFGTRYRVRSASSDAPTGSFAARRLRDQRPR